MSSIDNKALSAAAKATGERWRAMERVVEAAKERVLTACPKVSMKSPNSIPTSCIYNFSCIYYELCEALKRMDGND